MKLSLKSFIAPIIVLVISLVFCVLFLTYDVQAIGPNGTSVGFAGINGAFASKFGFNETLYKISDYLGYLSILGVVIFACQGLYQLIKYRGLKGVDNEILLLGGIFLLIFILYVLFNEVALNFRPIIEPGKIEPEASFPSSHVLMASTVMGAIFVALPTYVKNKKFLLALKVVCILIFAGTVICRLFCGIHWVTDIAAGLLISSTLLSFFKVLYSALPKKEEE